MFVDYQIAKSKDLPPMPACLFQYILAANGVFVRAERRYLSAQMRISHSSQPVKGLGALDPYVTIPRIPIGLIYSAFIQAYYAMPDEILFYLRPGPWRLDTPPQRQSPGACQPDDPGASADVVVEIHSHHRMEPYFSGADNKDESPGFRIYSVLGRLNRVRPQILTRVGIYGHFWEIPSRWVYDLPPFVDDVMEME